MAVIYSVGTISNKKFVMHGIMSQNELRISIDHHRWN